MKEVGGSREERENGKIEVIQEGLDMQRPSYKIIFVTEKSRQSLNKS